MSKKSRKPKPIPQEIQRLFANEDSLVQPSRKSPEELAAQRNRALQAQSEALLNSFFRRQERMARLHEKIEQAEGDITAELAGQVEEGDCSLSGVTAISADAARVLVSKPHDSLALNGSFELSVCLGSAGNGFSSIVS